MSAKAILENEGVIGLATDTIWGLASLATSIPAVEKIYTLKQREARKPLVLFAPNIEIAQSIIEIPQDLIPWLNIHWPGALTFISRSKQDCYSHCHRGTPNLGIRIPNHHYCLQLLHQINAPLAVSSFNLSGEEPVKSAQEAQNYFDGTLIPTFGRLSEDGLNPSTVILLNENEQLVALRYEKSDLSRLRESLPQKYDILCP